jgi:hypothetical protein
LDALSVTVTAALNDPAASELKITDMLQLVPAANVAPHALVSPKSEGFAPVSVMLLMFNVALPGLDSTMTEEVLDVPEGWLTKLMLGGVNTACGAVTAAIPLPVKVTI